MRQQIKEHLIRTINHYLKFNGSFHSVEAMAVVLNKTTNSSNKIPSTKYLIKKHFKSQ